MKIQKMALLSVLTAGAIIIAIIESFIPSIWIPGVKLGLANIVILVILYEIGIIEAIFVDLLRVFLVGLLRGTFLSMGFLMSLTGAILSLGVMILFYLIIKRFSIIAVSVMGSLFHITGQILIAFIFLETSAVFYYLPIIAISAIITGILVGIGAKLIIRTGAIKRLKEKYDF